jgi:hypothetical protein
MPTSVRPPALANKFLKRILVASATTLGLSAGLAPAPAVAQTSDAWQFGAAVYVYLPTVSGSTRFPSSGGGSDINIDGSTILDKLKMAFMGSFEARKGAWGGFTDILYVNLGDSKSGIRDMTIGGNQLPAGASANADYDVKGTVWTLAGSYRAIPDVRQPLDVFAGARMLDFKQKLAWQLSGNVGSVPLEGRAGIREARKQNWDAIVGVKGRVTLGSEGKWFVPYYLDVGTGESDLTWQALTGIGYSFGWGDVVASWRYLDYKMKSGSNIESLNFNGPAVAAVFRW